MTANYWLVKTEPSTYSWEALVRDKHARWDGVRNFEARNNLRAMKKDDLVFCYHSGEGKEIVGIAKVVKEGYADPTAKEGDWCAVDLAPVKTLVRPVTLATLKADKALADLAGRAQAAHQRGEDSCPRVRRASWRWRKPSCDWAGISARVEWRLPGRVIRRVHDFHDLGCDPAHHDLYALAQGHLRGGASLAASAHGDAQFSVLVVDEGNLAAVPGDAAVDFTVEQLLDGRANLGVGAPPVHVSAMCFRGSRARP